MKKLFKITLALMLMAALAVSAWAADQLTVEVSTSTISVDGTTVSMVAYTINDNNYFKLRDVAYAISGSEKQFEVAWDDASATITMTPGVAYTPVGGEHDIPTSTGDITVIDSTASLTLDGAVAEVSAYEIGGNNYYKLRDLASILGFDVSWIEETETIVIDTTTAYVDDETQSTTTESSTDLLATSQWVAYEVYIQGARFTAGFSGISLYFDFDLDSDQVTVSTTDGNSEAGVYSVDSDGVVTLTMDDETLYGFLDNDYLVIPVDETSSIFFLPTDIVDAMEFPALDDGDWVVTALMQDESILFPDESTVLYFAFDTTDHFFFCFENDELIMSGYYLEDTDALILFSEDGQTLYAMQDAFMLYVSDGSNIFTCELA